MPAQRSTMWITRAIAAAIAVGFHTGASPSKPDIFKLITETFLPK